MKTEFSTSWNTSSQPRKQRKYLHNAPLHVKQNLMSAHLSVDLRKKHSMRSATVRSGDEVIVQRGTFKKKKGKILDVDLNKQRVTIENITRTKKDGTKIPVFFKPSKLTLVALAEEKKRLKSKVKETKHAPNKSAS